MNFKERYNELRTQRATLRKEAIAAVCNKVTAILAGTDAKKLDYAAWSRKLCDPQCVLTLFLEYECDCDSGPVIAVEPKGTDSFSIEIYGEERSRNYTRCDNDISLYEIISLIEDLEALGQSLSGEASESKIEWKVNENGVIEYIGE